MKKINIKLLALLPISVVMFTACQKKDRPGMGEYLQDANPPGGPLKFYAAFDGTSSSALKNGVDSIRANYPSENPLPSIEGISGKAIQGETGKYVKFIKPNDWAATAQSFTVACWYKKNGQTLNNTNTNGPEYLMSTRAVNDYNWSNGSFLFFLEGNNTACAVKLYMQTKSGDGWLTWEGGEQIAGMLNNQWRHIAVSYNHTNSTATLYIDGVANANQKVWGTHGALNLDDEKIAEFRIGRGPRNDADGDGAGGWLQSSFKGGIDQFRLYGTALSATEINALFTQKK